MGGGGAEAIIGAERLGWISSEPKYMCLHERTEQPSERG